MGTLCPFIKGNCIGKECFMWNDERCLIRLFLEKAVFGVPQAVSEQAGVDREKEQIMREIDALSVDGLAEQLLDFSKKKFPDAAELNEEVYELFLKSKHEGLSNRDLSSHLRLKFDEVKRAAGSRFSEEKQYEREERYKKEKDVLPSLVDDCTEWAKQRGLKKVSEFDVDTFLNERNIKVLMEIKRLLHTKVSFKLKSII